MKAHKHEMFTVEMTNQELEDLVAGYIYSKYPFLKDEKVWSWDDFDISFKYREQDKVGVYSYYSKVTDETANPEKPKCDGGCSGCNKIDPFNTVCR